MVMEIEIYSDVVCPWCLIGKRRLERALAQRPELDLNIRWRAFQLNPDMPSAGMDRQAYLTAKFGGAERAGEIYSRVLAAAEGEGLNVDFDAIKRTPNTINAHRLIRRAGELGVQDQVVEALFQAYFVAGRDIGDLDVLIDIGVACGLDEKVVRDYLHGIDDLAAVQSEDRQARITGINGVPCFIMDGRYALSGAQEPEAFFSLFDIGRQAAE